MTTVMKREMQIQMANGASFDEAYEFVLMCQRKEQPRAATRMDSPQLQHTRPGVVTLAGSTIGRNAR